MDNKERYIEFLTYESYKNEIELWFRSHNLIYEKCELFYDFLYSLTKLVSDTYLGDDVMSSDDDIFNHFSWCFDKIVSDFEKERIFFEKRGEHHSFLSLFFYDAYYKSDKNGKAEKIVNYFELLFNPKIQKTHIEIDYFTELYKSLEQHLKN